MKERREWYREANEEFLETGNAEVLMEGLERELKEHDEDTKWLLNHLIFAANNLMDWTGDESDEEIESQRQESLRQIELLRRYGYEDYAKDQEDTLHRFDKFRETGEERYLHYTYIDD